jgi:predicted nucleic acid-binding protein
MVAARARAASHEALVASLLAGLPVIPFDLAAARVHVTPAADLRSRGTPAGAHDLLIAAAAVPLDHVAGAIFAAFPVSRA